MQRLSHPSIVLLVLCLILTSCTAPGLPPLQSTTSEPSESAISPENTVTISFGIWSHEQSLYEPLVTRFEARYPKIQVELVELDELLRPVFGTSIDAGTTRQVLSTVDTTVSGNVGGASVRIDDVLSLRPFADADASFDRGDFFPGILEAATRDGSLVMLPYAQWIPLVSYNKELWGERGVPLPSSDWTWDDLLLAAAQLAHRRGDQQVYGYADVSPFSAIRRELLAAGVPANTITAEAFVWNEPATVEALSQVVALAQSGALYVNPRNTGTDGMPEKILNGDVGMWLSNIVARNGASFQEWIPTFTIEETLLPRPPAFSPNFYGYVISAGTQYPEAAWRWISFLSQQPSHGIYYPFTPREVAPTRRSIAAQTGYFEQFPPVLADALRAQLEQPLTAGFPESLPFRDPLRVAVEDAFYAVFTDGTSPEQALAEAEGRLATVLADVQATTAAAPEPGPFVVATPVTQAAAGGTPITVSASRSLGQAVQQASTQFNASQADIVVTVEVDERAASIADLTVGADCIAASGPPTPEDIPALLDIQPYLDLAGGETRPLPPALLAPFQYEGQLLGLPLDVTLPTLGYQPEQFAQAGAEAPTASWTPNEALAAAQLLTDRQVATPRYGYASASGDLSGDVRFWLARLGTRLGAVQDGQITATLTDPATVAAAQFVLALLRETSPHTRLTGYSQETLEADNSGQTAIAQGQVGFWANLSNAGLDVVGAVAPVPLGRSGWATDDLLVSGLATKIVTRHADACWAWMQSVQRDWPLVTAETTRPMRFPADPTARDAAAASLPPETATLVAEYGATLDSETALTHTIPLGLDPYWFFRAVDRALQGSDLEAELAEAQTLTEQYLACVQGGEAPGQCARQIDPQYQGFSAP